MARLIVNSDDFGLTSGVNKAVAELHQAGVLSSATLMARAKATGEAIEIARAASSLGVGCHIVLVDGEPLLSPQKLPTLVDQKTRRFRPTLGGFLQRLLTGRIDSAEIEAEAGAQIVHLQKGGVRLTHIDTHKHTHMFPAVLRPVLKAARSAGIRAVRNPFEMGWSVRRTPSARWMRREQVSLLRWLEPAFRRIVAEEGLATTDGAVGVLATGSLDAAALRFVLQQIPPGTWELVCHPGYNDADLAQANTRLRESRETEREALQVLRQFPALELITFADLHSAGN